MGVHLTKKKRETTFKPPVPNSTAFSSKNHNYNITNPLTKSPLNQC